MSQKTHAQLASTSHLLVLRVTLDTGESEVHPSNFTPEPKAIVTYKICTTFGSIAIDLGSWIRSVNHPVFSPSWDHPKSQSGSGNFVVKRNFFFLFSQASIASKKLSIIVPSRQYLKIRTQQRYPRYRCLSYHLMSPLLTYSQIRMTCVSHA